MRDRALMMDRIPRCLRVAFSQPVAALEVEAQAAAPVEEVDFVAYGVDCILSGRAVLDGDRLSDMLNANDEYALVGVTVERLEDGGPMTVDEVVVGRDELFMVHASGPRGDAARRLRTSPQHVALQMGPYQVRGFLHGMPGTDPVASMRRRKSMVPLTNARIAFVVGGEPREDRVKAIILNRDRVDWVVAVEPDRSEFPARTKRAASVKAGPTPTALA